MARYLFNPHRRDEPDWSAPELSFLETIKRQEQRALHEALPGYAKTPLRDCPELASELGLGGVMVKDESGRYGIDAFKGLGASWAIFSVLRERWREETGEDLPVSVFRDEALRERLGTHTFAAATDGNHGRAVAWTAKMLGQKAVIFMPDDTALARVRSIEREGARAELVAGTFDDCVETCARTAEQEGWQVIADTAYPGNMVIPGHIVTGYSTIFAEIAEQTDRRIDAVFLPAGVGGLAAAGTASLVQRFGSDRPRLVCVEPEECACFLESAMRKDAKPVTAGGSHRSIMVGLCCATPSLLAWPIVRDGMDLFLAVEDDHAYEAMRAYYR
ncbi:MAG: diaminopropionate ammonia-lyase, partial [Myxococcota bacterium]